MAGKFVALVVADQWLHFSQTPKKEQSKHGTVEPTHSTNHND